MRKNKIAVVVMSIACMVSILSGCVFQQKNEIVDNTKQVKLRLSWWGNDDRHAYTMRGVDLFQEENPDIDVDYRYGEWSGYEKRNKVWMESHTEADVMQINYAWLSTYSTDGTGFYDLYELSDVIDLDNFSEEDLQFGEQDGKLNAIPIAFNTATIYYNQDIYDSYNVPMPTTWEDYFTAAKVMSKDDIYPIGMAKKQLFLFLISYYEQTTDKQMFSDSGELNADVEDIGYILDFYKQLLDEKVMPPVEQFSREKFVNGQIAGSMFWVSDAGSYCDKLDEKGVKVSIGEYPKQPGCTLSGWYMKPATMYAISYETKNPEEAGRLLNYLLNSEEMAEQQKTEKGVPASRSAVSYLEANGYLESRESEANQKMLKERDRMSIMIPVMENEDVINAFKSGADDYIYDQVSREEAARMIYENIIRIIEDE